jgi:hypothetical protein
MRQPANHTLLQTAALPAWLRRLGLAGFMFFLLKGIAWLAVPYLAASLLT